MVRILILNWQALQLLCNIIMHRVLNVKQPVIIYVEGSGGGREKYFDRRKFLLGHTLLVKSRGRSSRCPGGCPVVCVLCVYCLYKKCDMMIMMIEHSRANIKRPYLAKHSHRRKLFTISSNRSEV